MNVVPYFLVPDHLSQKGDQRDGYPIRNQSIIDRKQWGEGFL